MHRSPTRISKLTVMLLLTTAGLSIGSSAAVAQSVSTPDRDEIHAIVAEAMADAQTRSSLLAGGADAGHDGHFYLASPDGNFRLNVGGSLMFRYMADFRSDENTGGLSPGDDFDGGFQTRLTTLNFSGTIVDPSWSYFVEGGYSRDDGSFNLRDAYVGKSFDNGWTLLFGQLKAHVLREENTAENYQLAVERSVTNSVFNQGRSQGVAGVYTKGDFQFVPVFSDGAASENTDFNNPAETDWSVTGRVNWKPQGDWKQFQDFTSRRDSEQAMLFGAAAHYQGSSNTSNSTDVDTKVLLYTADATLEGDGWNAFATVIGRHIEADSFAADSDADDFGVVVQGGFYFSDTDELFGRYDVVIPDDERAGNPDPFNVLTFGWNRYFAGHAAKFTADVQYALEEIDNTALVTPSTANGLLGDTDGNECTLRLQFQLMF